MEVLYLDRLIAVNFLIDYCLLLAAGRVCGAHLRRWRFALAALIGAAYAGLGVLPGWAWLLHPAMKIALGCLMALVSFGGEAGLARCTAVFSPWRRSSAAGSMQQASSRGQTRFAAASLR